MNELLKSVIDQVSIFLLEKGYSKKGKDSFVKKYKENGREEVIAFSSRKGRGDFSDHIYIGVTSGIYFKKVNSLDRKVVSDFLNSYPIISGSIGHFNNSNSGFISIPLNNQDQTEEVSKIIVSNIQEGAFNLFKTYPDLKSVIEGIEREDDWLKDYTRFLDFREAVRLAAMYCIERGKKMNPANHKSSIIIKLLI
ncbi:MAG: hypothetical protein ACK5L5_08035 [Bacteroidales bacterium]